MGERLEFLMSERQVGVISSTELRLASFDMAPIGGLAAGVAGEVGNKSASPEARVKWGLARSDEAKAVTWSDEENTEKFFIKNISFCLIFYHYYASSALLAFAFDQ
jgi:hypothetical protein